MPDRVKPPAPLHDQPLILDPATNVPTYENHSLTGFLRDVFQPSQSDTAYLPQPSLVPNQSHTLRDLMDFGQDLSLEFNDLDAVLTGDWGLNWLEPALLPEDNARLNGQSNSTANSATIDESINLGTAAYNRSAWRWEPNDERVDHDHALASVLLESHGPDKLPRPRQLPLMKPLHQKDRDRIVALLLASCERGNYQNIVSLFPAVRVLDIFMNDFLLVMEHSIDSWFHTPTFVANESAPELLTLMIAGGAILSRSSHAQKFGYALQEKGRLAIAEMFERDGRNTRSLQALQAYSISLNIGTWSGDKRKMELAESNVLPLITMLRRSGAFRRSRSDLIRPSSQDDLATTESKWRAWVSGESSKRLVFHLFLHCVQVSAAFQTPPLVSYAEITLDLPAPQGVWRATSATEWRDQYLALGLGGQQLPSFLSCMRDPETVGQVLRSIDLEFTMYLVLLAHWCLAREYTELNSANKAQAQTDGQWAGSMLASSKRQELQRLFDTFQGTVIAWNVFVPKEVHMTSQLLRMNLCVAFEDLQLLAGKEGEDEARRVLPFLKQWYRTPECRQAMCHAGKILSAARRPAGRSPNASRASTPDTPWLRDFHAVALYHAGLAFWAYGLLTKAISIENQREESGGRREFPIDYQGDLVYLDEKGAEEIITDAGNRFIRTNQGRAVISSVSPFGRGSAANAIGAVDDFQPPGLDNGEAQPRHTQQHAVPLDESQRVMEVMVDALATVSQPPESSNQPSRSNHAVPQRPAMVENLIQLMRDLGTAASAV
uniref:Xylanolytic transcriptional activator regulatory domain-containing protein n=1 Tax=Ramularia collo-cygni TaxID=112498 RepID=A0A2D3VMF6_9PEZI